MFNKYFHSVYTSPRGQPSPTKTDSLPTLTRMSSIELSVDEVYTVLQDLDPSKAHGPDGIPARILKECKNHNQSTT